MNYLYTDGACKGNPGPGGFGVVAFENNTIYLQYKEQCEQTTNNREELKAILHAFQIAEGAPNETFIVYSDSAYCVNMLNDWIWTWARNGWKNSKKKEVENIDLVKQLYNYISKDFFNCQVVKVSGHDGNIGNELADALATFNKNKYFKLIEKHSISHWLLKDTENLW